MNVPIGPTSIFGWVTFILSTLTTANLAIIEHTTDLTGPAKWTAILALVSFVSTAAGRYLQAHAQVKAQGVVLQPLGLSSGFLSGALAPPAPLVPPAES